MKINMKKYINSCLNSSIWQFFEKLPVNNLLSLMKTVELEKERLIKIVKFLQEYLLNGEWF